MGFTWTRSEVRTFTHRTRCSRDELDGLLAPFAKGPEQFVSKEPMSRELAQLLAIDGTEPPSNFVAVQADHRIVLAAGYPWEVGTYELPLLRAMHRHWLVFERLRADAAKIEEAFFKTMDALAVAAEFYDTGTGVHIRRVGTLSGRLAGLAGQDSMFVKGITQAAKVHDVGKITIPLKILSKPSSLTDEEMAVMKRHAANGAHVLGDSPHLGLARSIALNHHENYDGSGYPHGLVGENIPLEARIVRLMDVYDALRSERHYKPPFSHTESIRTLIDGDDRVERGSFDPELLDLLIANGRELSELYDALGDSEE
jgi:response regulator RpfG family c-di-GMP phosphodiesterase